MLFTKYLDVEYSDFKTNYDNDIKLELVKKLLNELKSSIKDDNVIESYYLKSLEDSKYISAKFIDLSETCSAYSNDEILSDKDKEDIHHITTPDNARDIAKLGLKYLKHTQNEIHFAEPHVGTGILFLMLEQEIEELNKKSKPMIELKSSVGIEYEKKNGD